MRKAWTSTPRLAKRKQRLPEGYSRSTIRACRLTGKKVSTWWISLNSVQRSMLLSVTIHLLIVLGVLLGAFTPAEKMMARMMPELIDVEVLKEQEKKRRSVIFLEVPSDMATEEEPRRRTTTPIKTRRPPTSRRKRIPTNRRSRGRMRRAIASSTIRPSKPKPPEPKQEQPKPLEKSKPTVESKPKPKQAESLNPIQAKPEPKPKPKVEPKPKPKPRRPNSVAEARQLAMLAGDKMKRDGGVRRKASIEGLDGLAIRRIRCTPHRRHSGSLVQNHT